MGEDAFNKSEQYDYLKDILPPVCFVYIFNIFMELWGNKSTDNSFTWTDLKSYCDMRKIELRQYEISLIMKCKSWANNEISKLKED